LEEYPHPLLAPGVAFSEDRVIVIGGYDIVAGETDMLSGHYQMEYEIGFVVLKLFLFK
jgi:hypothetical protein